MSFNSAFGFETRKKANGKNKVLFKFSPQKYGENCTPRPVNKRPPKLAFSLKVNLNQKVQENQ